ncbi:hypothetical protein [Bacillus thuringiensis]|uniref:Uncharacterized protein n=1 Tax=Bacillus thuringiensis TaxID=1428 RepID=A0A9X6ZQF7_BACTU|nr:hypothetical protein [Bacillus thuringiensis]PFJ32293.1 hypothetical protein COJ15_28910 [Bacillus thuringiensis]
MLNELIQISKELSTDEKISSLINSISQTEEDMRKRPLPDKTYLNELRNRRLAIENELGNELEKRLSLDINKEQLLDEIKNWKREPLNPTAFTIASNFLYEKLKKEPEFILKMSYLSSNSPGGFFEVLGHSQRLYDLVGDGLSKLPKGTVFSEYFQC